jgi:3-methyladenine DNA glycosylase AlkD
VSSQTFQEAASFLEGADWRESDMELIEKLQVRLEEKENPKTKTWWENYMRQAIPFRGVKMAGIRAALHAWLATEEIASRLSFAKQKTLALRLLREAYAEDKLAGILYLQEVLLPARAIDCPTDLPQFAALFEEGHIDDWNTCDWFCVKVLGPLAEQQGETCARAIAAWKGAGTLWQRRAAGVAFVNLASAGEENFEGFTDMLLAVCATTVQDPARFAQTGTGWVLRELGQAEQERVLAFIREHRALFSREALIKASEKMPDGIQQDLLQS